jgi:di/tricarboxylate transporter
VTTEQIAVFVILAGAVALFVWDRLRYDLVALAALLVSVIVGVVSPEDAFRGFSDDIVIIVGSALVVSAAVARSGIAEMLMRHLEPWLKTTGVQIAVLAFLVAVMSAFMKNIGALAILMPIAFQISKRTGQPVSRLLMPMSFAALLGGLMTLIGTSPNIIASRMRAEILGEPFGMFDFMPVGLALTVVGIVFLSFGWRLLPKSRKAAAAPDELFSVEGYQAEARVTKDSPFVNKTVQEFEEAGEGDVSVAAIIREGGRRYVPSGHWWIFADDVLVLLCDAHALSRIVNKAKLELQHDKDIEGKAPADETVTIVEAVIKPGSPMVGRTAEGMRLRDFYGVNLLALSQHGQSVSSSLGHARFRPGDLAVVRVRADELSERLGALGLLPLAERRVKLGPAPNPLLAVVILAAAMILAASGITTVAVAFFGAAVAVLLCKALTIKEAYDAIEWPILILLGALIPVSEALRTTGGSELIAGWLATATQSLPPMGSLALIMIAAMAVTPFLNNAATVLLMAPIGASLATRLGMNPDPFLMAVAVGAACDFLTPIGHQCNTLVMGPGGYRFTDYWRLGLPLSILVVLLGVPMIALVWPFAAQ